MTQFGQFHEFVQAHHRGGGMQVPLRIQAAGQADEGLARRRGGVEHQDALHTRGMAVPAPRRGVARQAFELVAHQQVGLAARLVDVRHLVRFLFAGVIAVGKTERAVCPPGVLGPQGQRVVGGFQAGFIFFMYLF